MFRILVVRLGAMGDVIHCLPAVATLKQSFPNSHLTWVVKPQWAALLEGNPYIDQIIPFERTLGRMLQVRRELLSQHFDLAVDLQGLIQSALIATAARPDRIVGLDREQSREGLAALFYSMAVHTSAVHRVDRYLELAASAGARNPVHLFPLPQGTPEGRLPEGPFILACPLAGWGSKQWPLEAYSALAAQLQLPLVVNGPPNASSTLESIKGASVHLSGVAGLIDATRRAKAVIGVDSGPLHLAAALGKPGVAIYGPTDPASHGPYGGTLRVLRDAGAVTSYKRSSAIDQSMRAIRPEQVATRLAEVLALKQAGAPA
ncbi:MAG: glycosyltransferase family 9 protein [Acidobacteriota bacterium]